MNEFSFKVIFDKILIDVVLAFGGEWLFQGLEQQSVELLDILLHLCLLVLPLETLYQLFGCYLKGEVCLQLSEQLLQLVNYTVTFLGMDFLVVTPSVYSVTELRGHE